MLRSEAANDLAKKRRINRIKEAKDNEVAHETMRDEGIVRNNIDQQLLLGENIPGLRKRALFQTIRVGDAIDDVEDRDSTDSVESNDPGDVYDAGYFSD